MKNKGKHGRNSKKTRSGEEEARVDVDAAVHDLDRLQLLHQSHMVPGAALHGRSRLGPVDPDFCRPQCRRQPDCQFCIQSATSGSHGQNGGREGVFRDEGCRADDETTDDEVLKLVI